MCFCSWHSAVYGMKVSIFTVSVLECMYMQTGLWFILSSERVRDCSACSCIGIRFLTCQLGMSPFSLAKKVSIALALEKKGQSYTSSAMVLPDYKSNPGCMLTLRHNATTCRWLNSHIHKHLTSTVPPEFYLDMRETKKKKTPGGTRTMSKSFPCLSVPPATNVQML